eukprot:a2882_39.p2 GENE.a2882_39~~a2882_39.p2  ORF type:complete len:389 (-),score=139.23 a2882_39:235-1374(-)
MATSGAASLFAAVRIGAIQCANRVVMAPLTRMRAAPVTNAPHALNVTYYEQRASAGLIVTEGTQVCAEGQGYFGTPGCFSDAHEAGWRAVTEAVHRKGGKIVAQLWHVGAISHPLVTGGLPLAASAVNPGGFFHVPGGDKVPRVTPQAMTAQEVWETVSKFGHAALVAQRAGFDGVEIHGAHNYLLEGFIRDSSNKRTDEFGGSIANRLRMPLAVVDACAAVFGADRVGIRLSPVSDANGAVLDSTTQETYGTLLRELDARRIAFVHLVEGQTGSARRLDGFDFAGVRALFGGTVIVNNQYTREMALDAVASGHADCVSFGVPFIANPDLVERLAAGAPLNKANGRTFYTPGPVGYTDYPTLPEAAAGAAAAASIKSKL